MERLRVVSTLCLLVIIISTSSGSKYGQRVFEDVAAINFAEAERNGFRVVLSDSFIERHLQPGSLPTIFVTAIPLRPKPGQRRYTHVFYPEKNHGDRLLVRVNNLRAKSWYYICIEWENINRHNDTTGTSCKLYRTLDKFGKVTSTTISELTKEHIGADRMKFRLKYTGHFPIRLTAYLRRQSTQSSNFDNSDGDVALTPAGQTFILNDPTTAQVVFPFLDHSTDYGRLCVLEEPLVSAYTAMGRLVTGLTREKCYFDHLKTSSYHQHRTTEPEARAYKHIMAARQASRAAAAASRFNNYSIISRGIFLSLLLPHLTTLINIISFLK